MDSAMLAHLFALTAFTAAKIAAPALIAGLAVGLLVSLFQALTQINEQTLAFLPKLIVTAMTLWLTVPWITQTLCSFTVRIFELMAGAAR